MEKGKREIKEFFDELSKEKKRKVIRNQGMKNLKN